MANVKFERSMMTSRNFGAGIARFKNRAEIEAVEAVHREWQMYLAQQPKVWRLYALTAYELGYASVRCTIADLIN